MITSIMQRLNQWQPETILNWSFWVVLAIAVLAFIYFELIKNLQAARLIKALRINIGKANGSEQERFKTIGKGFAEPQNQWLKHAWQACQTSRPMQNDSPALCDLEEHFDASALLTDRCARKAAESIPGVLTAAGILLGGLAVLAAFQQSGLTADATGTTGLLPRTVAQMLILLIGSIVLALLFAGLDRQFANKGVRELHRLISALEGKLTVVADQDWIRQLTAEQQTQTDLLVNMGPDVANQINNLFAERLIPDLAGSYRQAIEDHLKPSLQKLDQTMQHYSEQNLALQQNGIQILADRFAQRIDEQFSGQLASLAALTEQMTVMQTDRVQQLAALQQKSVDDLQCLLTALDRGTQMQNQINQEAVASLQTLSESRTQLAETAQVFNDSLNKTGDLAGLIGNLLESDRQMAERLNTERQAMQALNNGYIDKMSQQITQLQDDLNSEIESIFGRFTDVYSTTFEHIDEQTTAMIQNYSDSTHSVMNTMDEQVRDITFLTREVTTEISSLNERLEQSVKAFADKIRLSTEDTFQSVDQHVAELAQRLAYTAEIIRDSVDDLPAAVLEVRQGIGGEAAPDPDLVPKEESDVQESDTAT
ncbi:MAG: hypothetical protein VB070_13545 [Clostridiaceae bacterium]|nr:hypothetical protein [Clostridiaceae bacterium]